jgi:hypothetical protein
MALRVPRDTSATARAVALRAVSSGAISVMGVRFAM